jgi:hypothetical protein
MADIPAIITRGGRIYTADKINPAFTQALDRVTALRMAVPEDQAERLRGLEVSFEACKRYYEIAEMVTRTQASIAKLMERVAEGKLTKAEAELQAADLEAAFARFVATVVRLTPGEDESLIKHR